MEGKWFKEKELIRCYRERDGRCKDCTECAMKEAMKELPGYEENGQEVIRRVLDPLREAYGRPVMVNSFYRCSRHNTYVGSKPSSQHRTCSAADITAGSPEENLKLAKLIVKVIGTWDQMILYVNDDKSLKPRFVHVSLKRGFGNRRQILRKVNGKSTYESVNLGWLLRE